LSLLVWVLIDSSDVDGAGASDVAPVQAKCPQVVGALLLLSPAEGAASDSIARRNRLPAAFPLTGGM
jgi:hypothetical protein